MESILTSIKLLLGITAECTHFDSQIISHINSVFMDLEQLGVKINEPYVISNDLATWSQLFGDDALLNEGVKSYVHAKVKLKFDTPTNSALIEALERQAKEAEFRINVKVD